MARQRFIWPDIWTDPLFGRLKSDEKVLYIGLFSNADDEGRLHADPAFLRSAVFPYQEFTLAKMRKLRDSLVEKLPSIRLYTVRNAEYIALTNWLEWQRPQYPKPSKLPSPDEALSEMAARSLAEASTNVPSGLDEASIVGRDGLGRVDKGAGLDADPPERKAALDQLLNTIKEKDDKTQGFIQSFAFRLPAAAFYDAEAELLERRKESPRLEHEGRYVSSILDRLAREVYVKAS